MIAPLGGLMIKGDSCMPEFEPCLRVEIMRCVQEPRRVLWTIGGVIYGHPNTVEWLLSMAERLAK